MITDSPVLLIFFNRPETLKMVFEQVKKAKPKKLYLAQDGPRQNNLIDDIEKIDQCREIVKDIDWDCVVETNYSEINQGCGKGPFNAIDWVFEKEDRAIILEDDCVPNISFFRFCDEMLDKYNNDQRVFLVTGCNFELSSEYCPYSYFFGYSSTNWGWATWKRNWVFSDYYCNWINDPYTWDCFINAMKSINGNQVAYHDSRLLRKTYADLKKDMKLSYWDLQWQTVRFMQHQLAIIPSKNLISNIGIGEGATHAQYTNRVYNGKKSSKLNFFHNPTFELDFPLIHPEHFMANYKYDARLLHSLHPGLLHKAISKLYMKIRRTMDILINL